MSWDLRQVSEDDDDDDDVMCLGITSAARRFRRSMLLL